jgi:hypothetical protein
MLDLIKNNPFGQIEVAKDTRLYISFLKKEPVRELALPWTSNDGTYQILEVRGKTICSVLDLSTTQTPKEWMHWNSFLEKILPQEIGTPLIGLPTSADDQTDK